MPGVAAKMFRGSGRAREINIEMISTSEIKISVVIDAEVHGTGGARAARGVYREAGDCMKDVLLYDTTLRDGCQAEDISFTLEDKLRIAEKLEEFGIDYIEGGYPGSNPRDADFFKQVKKLKLKNAKIASFGTTRKPGAKPSQDMNLKVLLDAETPVVTLVGKTWDLHVRDDLRISQKANLELIADSIALHEEARRSK